MYFEYDVDIYEEDLQKSVNYCGVTTGETYFEALSHVADYFGERNIISIKLEAWDETNSCLILTKEALKDLKDNLC